MRNMMANKQSSNVRTDANEIRSQTGSGDESSHLNKMNAQIKSTENA